MLLFIKRIFFCLILFLAVPSLGQIRFYTQYEGIPLFKGGTWDFNVLSGVKISPDKEVVLGLGLIGKYVPGELKGELKFSKSSFSLGFNYYQNRKLYYNFNVTANVLNDILKAPSKTYDELLHTFLFDYQININYIVLRRLHFSFGTGIVDFTNLVINTAHDFIVGHVVQPDISLSLKLYVFQIKL